MLLTANILGSAKYLMHGSVNYAVQKPLLSVTIEFSLIPRLPSSHLGINTVG